MRVGGTWSRSTRSLVLSLFTSLHYHLPGWPVPCLPSSVKGAVVTDCGSATS